MLVFQQWIFPQTAVEYCALLPDAERFAIELCEIPYSSNETLTATRIDVIVHWSGPRNEPIKVFDDPGVFKKVRRIVTASCGSLQSAVSAISWRIFNEGFENDAINGKGWLPNVETHLRPAFAYPQIHNPRIIVDSAREGGSEGLSFYYLGLNAVREVDEYLNYWAGIEAYAHKAGSWSSCEKCGETIDRCPNCSGSLPEIPPSVRGGLIHLLTPLGLSKKKIDQAYGARSAIAHGKRAGVSAEFIEEIRVLRAALLVCIFFDGNTKDPDARIFFDRLMENPYLPSRLDPFLIFCGEGIFDWRIPMAYDQEIESDQSFNTAALAMGFQPRLSALNSSL